MTPGYWQNKQRIRTRQGEVKTEYSGYSFSSKLEASVFQQLKLREAAGEIRNILVQQTVRVCGPTGHACDHKCKIDYIPDFSFQYVASGERGFCEAKGFETPHWKLKLRMWRHYGPGPLELWKGTWLRPVLVEVITPRESA